MINKTLKSITLLLLILIGGDSFGQQDPMYTQYMFNTLAVNPAYAGSRQVLNISGLYRTQWVGLDGAPTTQTFYAHSPILVDKMAVGFSLVNDKIGPVNQTMMFLDYSYTINITEGSKLAFGLKAGMNMLSAGLSDVETTSELIDNSFTSDIKNKIAPNFGFGMYYHSDKWYVGVSTPKILENKYDKDVQYSEAAEKRHFFLIGGYVMDVTETIKFKPAVLTKITDGAPLSVDLTANFLFNDKIWLGAAYRLRDSFAFLLELQLTDQLRAGYAYDYTVSGLRKSDRNVNSHEIMLSYDFIFNKNKIMSPRYF